MSSLPSASSPADYLLWLDLPETKLRAYLVTRGITDARGVRALNKVELVAQAITTAARLGEERMHVAATDIDALLNVALGHVPLVSSAATPSEVTVARAAIDKANRGCAHCGGKPEYFCSQCPSVGYCGKSCQAAGWPAHKLACLASAKLRMASFGGNQALVNSVEKAARKEIKLLEEKYGMDNEDTIAETVTLCSALFRKADYKEAVKLLRDSLPRAERVGSRQTPAICSLLAENLRSLLSKQKAGAEADAMGNEAVTFSRRALALTSDLHGAESVSTLTLRSNYAGLLKQMKRFDEAEVEFDALLEICPRVVGHKARLTLMVKGTYAELLELTNRLERAETIYRDAVCDMREALGSEDPFTLSGISGFADVLIKRGSLAEAEPLLREALAGQEKLRGPKHPYTHIAAHTFATCIAKVGKADEAEAFLRGIIAGTRFGPLPRDIIEEFEFDLASFTSSASAPMSVEAVNAHVASLDARFAALHNAVTGFAEAIAPLLSSNAISEAPLPERTLTIVRSLCAAIARCSEPPRNIETAIYAQYIKAVMTCMSRASTLLRGGYDTWIEIGEVALASARALLGARHETTRYTMAIISQMYAQRGSHEKSSSLAIEVLVSCRDMLGDLAEDTAYALVVAANACKWAKKYSQLGPVLDKMRDVLESPLSPAPSMHLSVRAVLLVRAQLLLTQSGKVDEAEALLRRAVVAEEAVAARIVPEVVSPLHARIFNTFLSVGSAYSALGELLQADGRSSAAINAFRAGLLASERDEVRLGLDAEATAQSRLKLATALLKRVQSIFASPARTAFAVEAEQLFQSNLAHYARVEAAQGVPDLFTTSRCVHRHYIGELYEATDRLKDALQIFSELFAAILACRGPSSKGYPSRGFGDPEKHIGSFEHQSRVLRKLGLYRDAAMLDAAQVIAPPTLPTSFVGMCDRIGCARGLLWRSGPMVMPPPLTPCKTCATALYCSPTCSSKAWDEGHREHCGRINAAPQPLRLVAPLICRSVLYEAGLEREPKGTIIFKGISIETTKGDKEGLVPDAAAAKLARIIRECGAQRAFLIFPHCWLHTLTGAGGASGKPGTATIFEIMPVGSSALLDAQTLADASRAAVRFVFEEEDRIARSPCARYESTGMMVRVGMMLPPHMAASVGAETDAAGRVIRLKAGTGAAGGMNSLAALLSGGGGGCMTMISPVVRWATLGPFHCSEMTASDISLKGIDVRVCI